MTRKLIVKRPRQKPLNMKVTLKDRMQDKQIKQLKKRIKNPEIKYTDTDITGGAGFALTTAGAIFGLNYNAQGTQPYQRVGNQIKNLKLELAGYLTLGTTEPADRLVRIQLLWDKAPTGAYPAIYAATNAGNPAINDNSATATLLPNIFAPKSVEYKDRFQIIYERIYKMKWGDSTHALEVPFRINKKLNGKATRFDNTPANVASYATNALFICFTVDNVQVAAVQCNFHSRVFYLDD